MPCEILKVCEIPGGGITKQTGNQMETRFLSDSTLYESVEMNFNNTNCVVLWDPPEMFNLVTYAF